MTFMFMTLRIEHGQISPVHLAHLHLLETVMDSLLLAERSMYTGANMGQVGGNEYFEKSMFKQKFTLSFNF